MNPIHTLIIDDERPALLRAERLLKATPDFSIIAACTSPAEALDTLNKMPVDLLLLDIEMPGMSGFELLNRIDRQKQPVIVFVTAYDEYAVNAFEYYAIDYLLKPYSNERFGKMLDRVQEHFLNRRQQSIEWTEVMRTINTQTLPGNRIAVKTGKKYDFIEPSEIAYVCADGNYCTLWLHSGAKYIHRITITQLLSILPAEAFIRIHHSHIVAIKAVKQVSRLSFNEVEVKMQDGHTLKVSRKYKAQLLTLLR